MKNTFFRRAGSKGTIFLLLCLLSCFPDCLNAANEHFRNLSIHQGLSQNSINAILQDRKGFIWIATQDGLNRFDGYTFKIFKFSPTDPASISDNYINAMIQDSRGKIWLGTEEGLNQYDPEKERFIRYYQGDQDTPGLTHNHVTVLYEAPSLPGSIWVGSERGLNRLDLDSGRFILFRSQKERTDSLSNDYIQCLFEAPSKPGYLWVGTREGLSVISMSDGLVERVPFARDGTYADIKVIYEAPSLPGTIWVGHAAGLERLDMNAKSLGRANGLENEHSHIRALLEPGFDAKTLWIGTYGGGIVRYSLDKDKVLARMGAGSDHLSLSDNFILSFFEDRSQLLWIGTQVGGISQYSPQTRNFILYRAYPSSENSLSHRTVRAIYESGRHPGKVWVGTYGGLDLLDRESGHITRYRHNPGSSDGPGSNLIRAVLEDRKGRLWVGTQDAGLSILGPSGTEWTHYRRQFGPTDTIRCLLQDRKGAIWIGSSGDGLSRYDDQTGTFHTYRYEEGKKGGISSDRVYSLIEDRRGRIWAGTAEGLNRIDGSAGPFTVYRNDAFDSDSLSNNMVMSLHEDGNGRIWVGTWGGGLNRYDERSGRFDHFTENEGLANNVVYGILEDDQGKLWLSTNNGLSRFDPLTLQFRNFDVTDGLQSNEFNANAHHRGGDGLLYFGGINGLTAFYPSMIRENPYQPPLVITDFQLSNRSVPIGNEDDAGAVLKRSIEYTESLSLSYRDLIIGFEFSALSFVAPEKNRYAYMMEGLEKDWNHVGARRFVTYNNLPPGSYRFRVKGANHDGFWNEIGTHIDLVIAPPFWHRLWFRIAFVILLLVLIQALLALRTRALSRRKRVLEQVVRERTRELMCQNEELERMSLVARHTDNGVLIMDAKGDVEWINEGFTRMYGYTFEDLIRERGKNMMTVSHRDDFASIFARCVDSREPVVYENQCPTREGKKKWAQTVLNPILDGQGRLIKLILIDSDITLLKEANARTEEERIAAQEANRAKSNFLARMSHEIRTPMNGVIGFTDILLETQLTPEQRDYLYTIKSSGESLLYLINDILDFSKIENGNMVFEHIDFNFEQLICETCEIVAPRAEFKEVELVCTIEDTVPAFIRSDPLRLRQVLINLLDNALKFTEKGVVELSVSTKAGAEGKISLTFVVSDTGPGIAADKQQRIFNVFTQEDESISRRHGGTGLGLAICRQIANQMQGDISLVSELGKGCVFTFTALVDASEKSSKPIIPKDGLRGKKALIVDDNSCNLKVLSHILKGRGMEVTAVENPAEVVPQLEASLADRPFDICIIDILMPMIDGFSLASTIRKMPHPLDALPLLAYSSSVSSQVSQYRQAGFSAFLTKPIQKRKLLRMVYSLIEKGGIPEEAEQEPLIRPLPHFQYALHVLLVEDNAINRKLIDRVLSKAGHTLTMVDNGLEAVEEVEKNPHRYDIIFMDIHMPVMDGLTATRRIRERGYSRIPIVALTADSMKGDREKCLQAGMNDYLSKPVNRDELLRILRKWGR